MATLIKEHEGLMFNETFDENSLIWSLSPSNNDCLRYEPAGLHILHNNKYVTYTMKETEKDYCLIAKIDHIPLSEEDIGGMIILSDTNDYAECQSYLASSASTMGNNGSNVSSGYDLTEIFPKYTYLDADAIADSASSSSSAPVSPTTGYIDQVYQYIKLIKYNNDSFNTYQFFASIDGDEWIEVGSADYSGVNSIGFFLYSTEDDNLIHNGNFTVNSLYIYDKKYITIKGISINQDFELFDSKTNKTILRSDTTTGYNVISRYSNKVVIDTTGMLLPFRDAYIRIYPNGKWNQTISQFTLENLTFGGDEFNISYDIQLRIQGNIIEPGTEYDLGDLLVNTARQIEVYNNEDIDFIGIKLSVEAYSSYFSGEEVVKLAIFNPNLDTSAIDSYNYSNYVIIDKLASRSGVRLLMKLSKAPRQDFYSVANKYKFKLIIDFVNEGSKIINEQGIQELELSADTVNIDPLRDINISTDVVNIDTIANMALQVESVEL